MFEINNLQLFHLYYKHFSLTTLHFFIYIHKKKKQMTILFLSMMNLTKEQLVYSIVPSNTPLQFFFLIFLF